MDRRTRRTPSERPLIGTVHWGAVLFGAGTGLAASLFAALALFGLFGAGDDGVSSIVLLFLVYASQLLAGYIAGRYAGDNGGLHGGFAGLLLFFVTTVFAIASQEPTFLTVVFGLVVAGIIGTAGGALADWRRLERDADA